jgi:hypothetical protein
MCARLPTAFVSDADLTIHQAAVFVGAATYAYCPTFIPQISPVIAHEQKLAA